MLSIIKIDDLPFVEFGDERSRRPVRVAVSPETTGQKQAAIVYVVLPPGVVAEQHVHEDCDELIYFVKGGAAILEDKEYKVHANSIFIAPKGMKHACRNTNKRTKLSLLCIFLPAFTPYGSYPELMKKTKEYLLSFESNA
jgi:mannose-6-phosphate isomerase-like protein (cupin superfamily)